ncbi:MAG: hypothetical protein Q9195_001648 [Heterodermia aff. obscurata]
MASLWQPLHHLVEGDPLRLIENVYLVNTQNSTRPDLDQVQLVIQSTIDELEKAYILIDGLDECLDSDRQETFMVSIQSLLDKSNLTNIKLHVLVTSRLEQSYLGGISVKIRATQDEISSMIKRRVDIPRSFKPSLRSKVAGSLDLRDSICEQVATKADGSFLIADLHMKHLGSFTNVRDLREALVKLPTEVDRYYDEAWAKISGQEENLKDLANRTVSWLYHSQRQLKVDELRHALAVRPGDEKYDFDGLTDITDILEACRGLVIIEEHDQAIRLMHHTVREYFRKQEHRIFQGASAFLTRICLTYLSLDVFETEPFKFSDLEEAHMHAEPGEIVPRWKIGSNRLLDYPFLGYAAEFWGYHAHGRPEEECAVEILGFLCSDRAIENAHQFCPQVFHFSKRRHVDYTHKDIFPVRIAISFRLQHIACLLIRLLLPHMGSNSRSEREKNVWDRHWLLALLEAIENGLLSVTEALLDGGVDLAPASELPLTTLDHTLLYGDERPKTALDKSVFNGHEAICKLLVDRETGGAFTKRTMEYAVSAENCGILDLYLSANMDDSIQMRREKLNGILHFASLKGKVVAVRYSLENGALLESEDDDHGMTALGLAVTHGQSSAVQFLLEAGADVSAGAYDISLDECEDPTSILEIAVISQHIFKDRLYLVNEHTTTFSHVDILGENMKKFQRRLTNWYTVASRPLDLLKNTDFLAAVRDDIDHGKIITALLSYGAKVSVPRADGASLLHLAVISRARVNAVLEYLKRQPHVNLDVDTRDHAGRSPIHWAAATSNAEVMELLISHGADVFAIDDMGATTLHYAISSPSCATIALEHGCRVDKPSVHLGTPIQLIRLIQDQNVKVIKLLEGSLKEHSDAGNTLPESILKEPEQSKTLVDRFEDWLMSIRDKHQVLCALNIQMNLEGSQQQGYVETLAETYVEAQKKKSVCE